MSAHPIRSQNLIRLKRPNDPRNAPDYSPLIAALILPFALVIGSISGLLLSAFIDRLPLENWPDVRSVASSLLPPFTAGAITGALPLLALKWFYPEARFLMIGVMLTLLMIFAITLPILLVPSRLTIVFSRSLAMEMPGFLFSAAMLITTTQACALFDRRALRIVFLSLLILWFCFKGPFVWVLKPLAYQGSELGLMKATNSLPSPCGRVEKREAFFGEGSSDVEEKRLFVSFVNYC